MRASTLIVHDGVTYPSVIIRLLLMKEPIYYIVKRFNKKEGEWINKEEEECPFCVEEKVCKKHRELNDILNSEECYQINWNITRGGVIGPFLIKNNIVFYNNSNNLMLFFYASPYSVNVNLTTDNWIRKIHPFTVQVDGWTPPSVKKTLNMSDLMNENYTIKFGSTHILKIENTYGVYLWNLIDRNVQKDIDKIDFEKENIDEPFNHIQLPSQRMAEFMSEMN